MKNVAKTRLPEYFFGDHMNRDDKLAKNESISLGTSLIVEDFHASEPNLSRIPSPASSLASTKKLEWDSGADIGYNVYNSFKNSRRSKSFPTLNMDLSISQINKSDETQGDEISMENKVTDDDKKNYNVNYQCSSQLKPQESKRKNNFKHSTPIEGKMVSKVSKNSEKHKFKSKTTNKDECLQTTQVNICSRSVQTDENLIRDDQKVNKSQQTDTIKSQSSYSGSSLSKSSSFQYIPGSNKSKSSTESSNTARSASSRKTESRESNCASTRSEASKKNSETSNSTKNHSEESITSNSSPLGKMISTQQSKHLISDIDKSLHILQKFINSKNYTPDTKKHYARKIVNKIIASKYTEDSSTSSSNYTLSTSKSREKPIEPNIKAKSNDSKDVSDFVNKNSKSEKVSGGVQCDPVQKNISTDTNKNKKLSEKLEEIVSKNNKFTEETKHKNKLDLPNKNWKDAETLSEKLFEARKKSLQSSHASLNSSEEIKNIDKSKKRDYLIQHSKNERKRQLSWINNEISYLHRLKELLQKNDSSSNASVQEKSKNNSRHNSMSTDKGISSSISDIEIKFYQEFGSDDSSKTIDNMENLKKLSKYLTNDQIKYLIVNDAKNMHCQTCECCKQKNVDTSKTVERRSGEDTNKNKNSVKEFVSHDIHNCSFNSHSYNGYKFYENLIKTSKQNSPRENTHNHKHLVSEKSDAGIQCTLTKKKRSEIQTDTSNSTEFSKDTLNDKKNIQVFYKDSNFNRTDSQSTEYGRIDSEIVPEFKRIPRPGKENNYQQRRSIKYRQKQIKPFKPIAYFLTFEEESMYEYNKNRLQNEKPLENVTVKVPKLPTRNRTSLDGNARNLTLKDYLKKNRPDFVRSADWRRSIVSVQTEKKCKNIFTCAQMKELTSKKYSKLPEVQSKIHTCKIIDRNRQYRCMAKEFSKKLQEQALKGRMSIATCVNVMSSE